jgi:ribA/ribD-fused uncharacterized protein
MAIERFRDAHYFLSSMYVLTNWLDTPCGIMVPTSEHGYQLSKLVDEEMQVAVAEAPDGIACKNMTHEFIKQGAEVQSDFHDRKLEIMSYWIRQKFARNPDIAAKLLATKDEELIEGNTWDDTFWGVCPPGSRNGQNWLGRLLMQQREELKIVV